MAEGFHVRFAIALLLLVVTTATTLVASEADGQTRGIYSLAKKGTYRIPPELDHFKKTRSPLKLVNAEAFGFDPKVWQSDPSRIIYHGGKYHCWMIVGYVPYKSSRWDQYDRTNKDRKSWILYMTSEDTYNWTAVNYLPLGPKGSCYDLAIEQANVFHHKDKFYLFSDGWTTNVEKYGQERAGIFCLVADSPEGPWKQVGDVLVKPAMDDGKPVTDKPVTKYWGFDTVQETPPGATSSNVYVVRIQWEFGPSESRK